MYKHFKYLHYYLSTFSKIRKINRSHKNNPILAVVNEYFLKN